MKTVTVKPRQTLWDIAVEHCGSANAATDIARLNGISPTTRLSAGQRILVPDPDNRTNTRRYDEHDTHPATATADNGPWQFQWSGPVCQQDPLWWAFRWSGPVCIEAEPYAFLWSGPVCALDEGPWHFQWTNPVCQQADNTWRFQWTNPVCALTQRYTFRWSNPVCEQHAPYTFLWSNPVCAQRDRHGLTWQEMDQTTE